MNLNDKDIEPQNRISELKPVYIYVYILIGFISFDIMDHISDNQCVAYALHEFFFFSDKLALSFLIFIKWAKWGMEGKI